jgi:hypothetical protein
MGERMCGSGGGYIYMSDLQLFSTIEILAVFDQ